MFNNQYLTLLLVYKLVAWTITLHMVYVMFTTRFRVVQLMYRTLRGFQQSVPNLVVGVQTCCLDHYTSCGVGNVHDKFQDCTVDVQAATEILTICTLPCCRCTNLPLGKLHFTQCR